MKKRKSAVAEAAPETKKMKTVTTTPSAVIIRRSTRNSRTKAQELIKQQADTSGESSDESSSDDFVVPPVATSSENASGVVVTDVNSFLSDCSSSEDEESSSSPAKKAATKVPEMDSESDSSESSSVYFEKPSTSQSSKVVSSSLTGFEAIEKNILSGVTRLSDSEQSDMEDEGKPTATFIPTHVLFPGLVKKEENQESSTKAQSLTKPHRDKIKSKDSSLKKTEKSNNVKELDVSQLLALGESQSNGVEKSPKKEKDDSPLKSSSKKSRKSIKKEPSVPESNKKGSKSRKTVSLNKKSNITKVKSESEEGSDWEEVAHHKESVIPKEGVEVTVQLPDIVRRKKKKGFDMEAHIKKLINQNKRENQVLLHKVSLLCWLAHGIHVNSILNSPSLMGFALSLIPSQHCYPPRHVDLGYLEKITQWFKKNVGVLSEPEPSDKTLVSILEESLQSKKAYNKRILVLTFISMMRSLGIKTRLILSFQPLPLKPSSEELCILKTKTDAQPSTSKKQDKFKEENSKKSDKQASTAKKSLPDKKIINNKNSTTKQDSTKTPEKASDHKQSKNNSKKTPEKVVENNKKKSKVLPEKSQKDKSLEKKGGKKDAAVKPRGDGKPSPIKEAIRVLRGRKPSKYKDESSNDEEEERDKRGQTPKARKSKVSSSPYFQSPPQSSVKAMSDDSDFEPEVISLRKSSQGTPKDRRVLSSEEESKQEKPKGGKAKVGVDVWAEVFVEMEEKWICVDVPNGKVHCVAELASHATSPVLYVLGFGSDGSVRDVTRRYCPQFHSSTRKQRVDAEWWDGAVEPFFGHRSAQDREEEEDLNKQLQDRPLPTSIGEYKNHPLYVLNRHLLKFEAIYPPESAPLGFIRGETVYSRDCVFTLRSRETWMKEAKIVKPKQEPYKIVKARPKYDRMSGEMMKPKPLEIFGTWQVEDYVPPPAVDGKVPRNEYGNVELFKPTMLPKGTVHLKIPSLNRVAKKLQVDCAPAMVGFDYHCGACHPLFDGFVVCEEFQEVLLDAHRQEEEEREKRHEDKRQKRVYGNWRRLINGLLIREKLKRKYSFGQSEQGDGRLAGPSSGPKSKPAISRKVPPKPVTKPQPSHSNKRKVVSSDSDSD